MTTVPGEVLWATHVTAEVFLEWKREVNGASDGAYFARLPWLTNPFDQSGFHVYEWRKGDYAYNGPAFSEAPGAPQFHGRVKTRDEAIKACTAHARVLYRLHRWQLYMMDNDPPATDAAPQ